MIPGRLLQPGDEVYTDWFPLRGDSAIFRAILVDIGASVASDFLTIEVLTKNADETGDGDSIAPSAVTIVFTDTDDPGKIRTALVKATNSLTNGLKQLLRYKITAKPTSSDWCRVEILPAQQFDAAVGS